MRSRLENGTEQDQERVPLTPAFPAIATSKTSMGQMLSLKIPTDNFWCRSSCMEVQYVLLDRISNLDKQKFGKHSVI